MGYKDASKLSNTMRRQLTTVALTMALTTLSAVQVAAQATPEYRTAISEALIEFEAEHWVEARALFAHALQLYPNARALRGLGMSAFEMRDYVAAIAALRAALEHRSEPLTQAHRRHVQNLLARSFLFVGRVTVTTQPGGATVLIDGAPPTLEEGTVLVNQGSHQLRVDAEGYVSDMQRVDVMAGQLVELSVSLSPVPPAPEVEPEPSATQPAPPRTPASAAEAAESPASDRRPRRAAGWTLLGVGVASGAAALATGLIAHRRHQDLTEVCGGICPARLQSDVDQGERYGRTSTALTGAAVAAGAVGVVLLLLSRGGDTDEPNDHEQAAVRTVAPAAIVTRHGAFATATVNF